MLQTQPLQFSIESFKPNASYLLSKEITTLVKNVSESKNISNNPEVVVLCVGTDRSTGDCLGPLVGHRLSKNYSMMNIHVFGTLKEPVHAKNLDEKMNYIFNNIRNPFIIAIDASLGKMENIGNINLYNGPLFPGAGVNKNLQPVGDISITGIVNMSGFMEYIVLQNTRLSLVMEMAEIISLSLYISIKNMKQVERILI
jgi:putative sporulation protein YyaC